MNKTAEPVTFEDALNRLDCRATAGKTLLVKEGDAVNDSRGARKWFEDRLQEGASGWAQFSGVNVWVEAGQTAPAPDGILLAAELHVARETGGISHHLRHDGDRWIATMITTAEGAGVFLEHRSLLHKDKDKASKLAYEIAWEPGADGALRPVAFRFAGLVKP